ncbi:hypothetical protein D3C83_295350 [compost metagenome]
MLTSQGTPLSRKSSGGTKVPVYCPTKPKLIEPPGVGTGLLQVPPERKPWLPLWE